ncbi:hypothetical protein FRC01_013208 [Tulasnella sp. 417]|nr:hypothetical protein FRC01_013208 [Tulasnella sp. 417]
MLAFFTPRKLPPIPTGPQAQTAPDAEPQLTESPDELTPPKPLGPSNYPATPSLTSSGASIASTDQQTTPPNTADQVRPTTVGGDRARKHLPEPTSPLRNSTPPPSSPHPVQRSESAGPTTPEQQRSRPPRPPLPPVLGGDPNDARGSTQDGLSIISRTTYYTQRSAPGRARSRTTSAFLRDCHDSWVYVLCSRPKVLASLLQYIDFAEFHALCCTSKPMRNILDADLAVRDVILSRFVPGYRWGQAQVPMGNKDIRVDLRDLEALNIISGLPPTESTGRLQHFTNVHSRFVLLLRSRAPAWSLLPDFVDDPVWRLGSTTEQWPNLRELTFPAPLSYPATAPTKEKENRPSPSRSSSISYSKKQQCLKPIISFLSLRGSSHARRNHAPAYPVSHPRHPTGGRSDTYPVFSAHIRPDGVREDGTISSSILRRSSRKPPPPPPEYTPKALKDHRRRSRISTSYSMGSAKQQQPQLQRLSEHYLEDDTALFTPPRPAHLRANSLPTSVTSNTSDHSLSRRHGSASPTLAGGVNAAGLSNPHELILAATKSKAPVCRIFVPCEDFSGATLLACEGQLVSAGLWRYMKPGDIVCNLGYIPAADEKSKFVTSTPDEHWGWMVYNGESLVQYEPPLPPADLDAFELPSPMYYTHILPSFAVNPRFFVVIPPVPEGHRKREPDLTLLQLSSSMPSPATKSGVAGFARVKRFAWVGKVDGTEILATWRAHAGDELHDGFYGFSGEGWATQWVVEAEGTKEGKAGLLEALDPSVGGEAPPATEWELVRDKCTPGRLWLRLIITPLPTESTDELGRLGQA